MVQTSFTKTNGTWAIRLFGSPTETIGRAGQTIDVRKKDGGSKSVVLGPELSRHNGCRTVLYGIAPDPEREERIESLPGEDIVPAGFYVVRAGDAAMLIKVWRKNGRVRTYEYGNPNDTRGNTLPTKETLELLVEIGPYEAAIEYGRIFKRCSSCNLRLKNRLSRVLGIGPDCGRRFHGDDWLTIRWEAIQSIRSLGFNEKDTLTEAEWAIEEATP